MEDTYTRLIEFLDGHGIPYRSRLCSVGGTYISFASSEIAERLAGSVAGTILPPALLVCGQLCIPHLFSF
jgi:hypothetical protein